MRNSKNPSSGNNNSTDKQLVKLNTPDDGSCMFHAITNSILLPLLNNEAEFNSEFKNLFPDQNDTTTDNVRNFLITVIQKYYDNPRSLSAKKELENNQTYKLLINNLRERTVNEMYSNIVGDRDKGTDANPEYYSNFNVPGVQNIDETYLNNMKEDTRWAGEAELCAISELLKKRIKLPTVIIENNSENSNNANPILEIYYNGQSHYEAMIDSKILDDKELAENIPITPDPNEITNTANMRDRFVEHFTAKFIEEILTLEGIASGKIEKKGEKTGETIKRTTNLSLFVGTGATITALATTAFPPTALAAIFFVGVAAAAKMASKEVILLTENHAIEQNKKIAEKRIDVFDLYEQQKSNTEAILNIVINEIAQEISFIYENQICAVKSYNHIKAFAEAAAQKSFDYIKRYNKDEISTGDDYRNTVIKGTIIGELKTNRDGKITLKSGKKISLSSLLLKPATLTDSNQGKAFYSQEQKKGFFESASNLLTSTNETIDYGVRKQVIELNEKSFSIWRNDIQESDWPYEGTIHQYSTIEVGEDDLNLYMRYIKSQGMTNSKNRSHLASITFNEFVRNRPDNPSLKPQNISSDAIAIYRPRIDSKEKQLENLSKGNFEGTTFFYLDLNNQISKQNNHNRPPPIQRKQGNRSPKNVESSTRNTIIGTSFKKAKLFHCDFSNQYIRDVNFNSAKISSTFTASIFKHCSIQNANLYLSDFSNSQIGRSNNMNLTDFNYANVENAYLYAKGILGAGDRIKNVQGAAKLPTIESEFEAIKNECSKKGIAEDITNKLTPKLSQIIKDNDQHNRKFIQQLEHLTETINRKTLTRDEIEEKVLEYLNSTQMLEQKILSILEQHEEKKVKAKLTDEIVSTGINNHKLFTGRESDFQEIGSNRTVLISGPAGIGKSAFMMNYLESNLEKFESGELDENGRRLGARLAFFVEISGYTDPENIKSRLNAEFRNIASTLNSKSDELGIRQIVDVAGDETNDSKQKRIRDDIFRRLHNLESKDIKCIMGFDDAINYNLLAPYLPPTQNNNVQVIINSRDQDTKNWPRNKLDKLIELENIAEKDSLFILLKGKETSPDEEIKIKNNIENFLLYRSKKIDRENLNLSDEDLINYQDALNLGETLHNYPLYLSLAVEYIAYYSDDDHTVTFREYQKLHKENKDTFTQNITETAKNTAHPETLAASLSLSLNRLDSNTYKTLMTIVLLHDNKKIRYDIISECLKILDHEDHATTVNTRKELSQFISLNTSDYPKSYKMHDALRETLINKLRSQPNDYLESYNMLLQVHDKKSIEYREIAHLRNMFLDISSILNDSLENEESFLKKWSLEYSDNRMERPKWLRSDPIVHLAARYGNLEMLKWLEKIGLDINIKDSYNYTTLHKAIFSGKLEIVKWSVQNGLYITAQNDFHTTLEEAARGGNLEIAKYLVEQLIKQNVPLYTAQENMIPVIHEAVKSGNIDMVRFVTTLQNATSPSLHTFDDNANTCLHMAAYNGKLQMVKWLVEQHGLQVNQTNKDGETALDLAANNGYFDVVIWLYHNGSVIDAVDNGNYEPLHSAAEYGRFDMLEFLFEILGDEHIVPADQKQKMVYMAARRTDNLEMVKWLIEEKETTISSEYFTAKKMLRIRDEKTSNYIQEIITTTEHNIPEPRESSTTEIQNDDSHQSFAQEAAQDNQHETIQK